jgi:hypothetical protein
MSKKTSLKLNGPASRIRLRPDFDGSTWYDSLPYKVHVRIAQGNASIGPVEKLGDK